MNRLGIMATSVRGSNATSMSTKYQNLFHFIAICKKQSDYFYTTDSLEIGTTTPGEIGNHGYKSEGIAGYCFPEMMSNTVPLYRYYNSKIFNHFYTTNNTEIDTVTAGEHGYAFEGIACFVLPVEK